MAKEDKTVKFHLSLDEDISYARAKPLSWSANVQDRLVMGSFERATPASPPTVPLRRSTGVKEKLTTVE